MTRRLYVGIRGRRREVFRAASTPTRATHGDLFDAVVGPFRTRRAADFLARYGRGNPHLQSVADAERRAIDEVTE